MRLAFPGLMAALAEGATIVTPTPLLASVAIEQFNRAQLAGIAESWERPNIYSLDAWMTTCWQQARFLVPNVPSLLSLSQERELWRLIIEHDRPDLFDLRAMASLAQRASRVIAEYQIPTEGDAWSEHADAKSFLRWYREFQQRLKSENWITRSQLWHLLPGWINKAAIQPGPFIFAALTAVSPGLKRLQQRNLGITPSFKPAIANALHFESPAQELDHAARTVRYLLETERARSIGVLVADFKSCAPDLTRKFRQVLYPNSEAEDAVHTQSGRLLDPPVIANALLLLELAQTRIHHASAGAILRSPFIEGAAKERSPRALANNRLRRARELDFSLYDIEKISGHCPILQKVFKRVRTATAKMLQIMRPSDWSATFSDILEAARWPALENISEAEQLAVDQWQTALSELASLGLVSPPISFQQALTHLRAMLSRSSEQGSWSSPVQVLDANSSEGIEFDHVLVLNASEDVWPPPVSLSPLIPYKLQKLHQVPGSHPEAAAEERLRKTHSLFLSAPNIQLSFTGNLSPVLRPHVRSTSAGAEHNWHGATAAQSYVPVELQSQRDTQAPPLVQSDKVTGGSTILKSQSQCPFKAFAEYRLNARGDDEACFGFDAMERGNFAHKVLELLWNNLKTQVNLKALSSDALRALVTECVTKAVTDDGSGPIRTLTSEAERERLTKVVSNWLNVEKDRSEPFTVEQVEQDREVELSGLKLALRVDRMDRLKNGNLVLIDYKTGKQKKTKLERDRPEEPQLLVYAAAVSEPVDGLYFAVLRNAEVKAVGHGTGKHFKNARAVKDHKNEWATFIDNSRETVHRLAKEFLQGDAAVDPISSACEYCKIKSICRIGTAAASVDEDDEE